jgi:enoyl-CoA hydratase/carnithine racemase
MSLVLTNIENSVGTITMDHLNKRNALSEVLIEGLARARIPL